MNYIKNHLRNNTLLYKMMEKIWQLYYDYIKLGLFSYALRVFPINKNKIIVCSYYGKGYSDNCRAVIDKLIELYSDRKLKIVWVIDKKYNIDKKTFPKNISFTSYKSFGNLWHLVTAKIWIDNSRKMFAPRKRKKQVYFQLWHGSIMLKKVEKDAPLPKRYVYMAKKDSKNADYFVSGSNFSTQKYKEAFWYSGNIICEGTPRADILVNETLCEKAKERIRHLIGVKNEKLLLYAPTFRADGNLNAYDIDYETLKKTLEDRFSGTWKILVRLHPNISQKSKELGLNKDYIIDVSNYSDIEDLYLIADVCITDYSSVMFEYSYTNKPVFLYASDIDNYIDDRGFYFDIRKLPYPLARSNEELKKNILNFSNDEYLNNLNKFFEKIGLNETGKASEVIANKIIEIIEKGV